MVSDTSVLRQLARPGGPADRRRQQLVSTAVTGAGVFLLAGAAILTIDGPRPAGYAADGSGLYRIDPVLLTLAPFFHQDGLSRGGERAVVIGALLLVVSFALFGVQTLRTGTAARERRLAALSLAGATRSQVRRLAVLEGMRAAGIGGLLAGPGYLLLWLGVGLLLPSGARLLPPPNVDLLIAWPVIVLLLAGVGGLAAGIAARPAVVSPLGLTRPAPRPLGPGSAVVPVLGLLVTAVGLVLAWTSAEKGLGLLTVLAGAVTFSITGGRWLILLTGRIAARGGLITSLAGRRLLADVRSPGRVAAVLFGTGIAVAVLARIGGEELAQIAPGERLTSSTAAALGTAAVAALVAALIATASLAVGATEQVLDGRRGTAVLVALAASPRFVQRVVRRQLLLASVPAAVVGVLLGWLLSADFGSGRPPQLANVAALPIAVLIAGLAAGGGALIAARLVRPVITESATPGNLRTP
jgi:hypothetical protein